MDDDPLPGLGLTPVQLSDQARFEACFASLNHPISDYTFSQLFTWSNSLRILWKEIRGHLCVFANGTGDLTMLMPPIGDGSSDCALAEAFEVMDAYNRAHDADGRSRVEYASEELLNRFDRSRLVIEPMAMDYVYDSQRMGDLAGGALASKRQLKNRFIRNYQHRVEVYDPAQHAEACRKLLVLWKQQQDANDEASTISSMKRRKETLACDLALEHAGRLGMKGLVVYVLQDPQSADGAVWSLRGFTFGEQLGTDQASIVIEKTDLGVRGLAQFIFSEFCARFWADRAYINAGDDWGLPALAWTKMSYRPVRMLQKYALRQLKPTVVLMPQLGGGSSGSLSSSTGPRNPEHVEHASACPVRAVVRTALKEDVAAALLLERACFEAHRLSRRQLHYLQKRKSALFLVAELGGRIVGEGICLVRQHKRGRSGRIYSLAVEDSCRRQKIGQRLLRAMIDGLAARGVRRVYLEVERDNARAIRLYEGDGFRKIGELPDYYGDGKSACHMMYEISGTSEEAEIRTLGGTPDRVMA